MLFAQVLLLLVPWAPHDGPDPVLAWRLSSDNLLADRLRARLGPDPRLHGKLEVVVDPRGDSLFFDGRESRLQVADDLSEISDRLPRRHLTISAWVSVNTPHPWGSAFGVIQDNGAEETGFTLGYDSRVFLFALATQGADDGDGQLTYLRGETPYEEGRLYHLVATYDGDQMRLYVDGRLEAVSAAQSGDILYPDAGPVTIGGYVDRDETYSHHGRIRQVSVYDLAAQPAWVAEEFEHGRALTEAEPYIWLDPQHRWIVTPYLQYATRESIVVMWETSRPASSSVAYGPTAALGQEAGTPEMVRIHSVLLPALTAGTQHFYRVSSEDSEGRILESEVLTFQTAVPDDIPFSFCVISDTQSNPIVASRIATLAFGQRPHFVLHPGDLVGTGTDKRHWTEEFFSSMRPLIERVPFYPVLGNHEQDARHYYDYVAVPDPEYYYSFRYGNAEFFMLDSNRNVAPDSEQFIWLEKQLAASEATWKMVVYHHPAYSSDENDYGDLWKGPSTHGDLRVRKLAPLFDRYQVDVVWNGHIHSYERTWPILADRVVEPGEGTVYMITGGGGGGLETPGPHPPWFQNNVRYGHHYCYVAVNAGTMEFKAFDLEGRLFDRLVLRKGP